MIAFLPSLSGTRYLCKGMLEVLDSPNEPSEARRGLLLGADIFSLGITLYEMAVQQELPMGGTLWQTLRSGEAARPPRLLGEMWELIVCMITPEIDQRPTAGAVVAKVRKAIERQPPPPKKKQEKWRGAACWSLP